ncbi:hypothetical protein FEM08_31260 [Flavobacterium gilvum]|nr:hypothetical protein FEM08_31260 [Flavobacterium gilvum]
MVAKIPMIDKIANSDRQMVNHTIVSANRDAVLKMMDKKLTDKIIVRIGICFPIFKPKGKKPNIAKNGI